jgi:medium-chain acyl-[acyl-carrier-protein] hydrolase
MSVSTPVTNDHAVLQRWLPYCRLDAGRHKLRLLCFAHAGGSALVFHRWPEKLPWTVQVGAVQLPGRERRLHEPFFTRIPELIDELSHVLLPWIDRPVALLGHSLGAKLAFEFARRLAAQPGAPEIVHLFVSGCPAPHYPSREMPIYSLPDDQFMQRLREFGGTPQEVLANPDIMQFVVPRLRADFELDGTYRFTPGRALSCPLTAWAGDADSVVSADSLEAWGEHTTGPFQSQIVRGSHFALYEREAESILQIRKALSTFT